MVATPVIKSGLDYGKLKLSPKEAFLLSRIDGHAKLKDIVHLSSMGEEETFATILGLTLKEVVTFKEYTLEQIKGGAVPPRPPVDPRKKPVPAAPATQRPAPVAPTQKPAASAPPKPQPAQSAPPKPASAPVQAPPKPQPAASPSPARPGAPPAAPQDKPVFEMEEEQAQPATPRAQPPQAAPSQADTWNQMEEQQVYEPRYAPPAPPRSMPPRPVAPQGPRLVQPLVPRDDVVEDLSDLKLSGKFADKSYPSLLVELFRGKETGCLHIYRQKGGPYKDVYFRAGMPVFMAGTYVIEKECLGQLLKVSGKISDYDLRRSLEVMEETRDMQGQVFLRLGVLNSQMLTAALKWQLEIKLAEVFTWKLGEGYFEFYTVGTFHRPIEPIQINMAGLILKGIKRGFPFTAVQAELSPKMELYVNKLVPPLFSPDDFKFQLPEQRVWEKLVDGSKTVREVIDESKMDPQHITQFIFALTTCDMLMFRQKPAGTTDEDKLLDDLKQRLSLSQKGSLFDGLGIHWSSVQHKVQEGWEKIQREYGPESKLVKNAPVPEVAELAAKIYDFGKKAYEVLIDDKKRVEYRMSIFNETKITLSAELLYQQAESQLLLKEDYRNALENLAPAAEMLPRNYIIQAAYGCALVKRYYPSDSEKYREGEKIIQRALTAAGSNDMVHFFAGHGYWTMHRNTQARAEFEAAIRINPQNADARKALRAMSKGEG